MHELRAFATSGAFQLHIWTHGTSNIISNNIIKLYHINELRLIKLLLKELKLSK